MLSKELYNLEGPFQPTHISDSIIHVMALNLCVEKRDICKSKKQRLSLVCMKKQCAHFAKEDLVKLFGGKGGQTNYN